MVEGRRTELHPEVATDLEEARATGTHVRSSQLSVAGARALKTDEYERLGWLDDPEPVGNVREYPLETADGSGVPVRIYTPDGDPPFPVLVWYHGGGWVRGDINSVDPICRSFTNSVPCTVVSVGYRRAPEHPFPTPLEDCYTAVAWVCENADVVVGDPARVAVGGSSAGGNLAAAVSLLARDRGIPDIAYQILGVPVTDHAFDTDTYAENASGYGLTKADMEWYWNHYLPAATDAANPYAAPLRARELTGVPPATVVTAGFDPLRDDGIQYVERLRSAEIPVRHNHYPDMHHGVLGSAAFYTDRGRAREAVQDVADDLRDAFA